jgi:HK97 family phage prohead protease
MKKLEFRTLEIKSMNEAENGEMFIEGYGAYFGNVDGVKDIIEKGAFSKTLSENKGRIAFCWQHEIDEPIGKIETIEEDDLGLKLKVRISDSENEIKTKIREGILKELSVGFQTMISTYDETTDIRTIKEVKLWEVSLVTIAANELAVITSIKSVEEKQEQLEKSIDRLIENTKDKNNKFELLKLKSLFDFEPAKPLEIIEEPIEVKKGLNLSKYKFINT